MHERGREAAWTGPRDAQSEFLSTRSRSIDDVVGLNTCVNGARRKGSRHPKEAPTGDAADLEATVGYRGLGAGSDGEVRVTHGGRPNPLDSAGGDACEAAQGLARAARATGGGNASLHSCDRFSG